MNKIMGGVLIAALLILSGCATVDPKAVQSQTTGKSVAVVSATEEKLNLLWVGTTVFNNEAATLPVSDWKIGESIANDAIATMQKTGRYSQVFALEGITRKSSGFPKLPDDKKADFIVLIEPTVYQDQVFGTNQSMNGIGMFQRSMFNTLQRTVGHAALMAEVFDTHTGKSLGTSSVLNYWPSPASMETGPKLSDSALAQFKESSLIQLQLTVAMILEKLGLK